MLPLRHAATHSVVYKERMWPGHWSRSVLYISFSALTLMVGWQDGHPAHKTGFSNPHRYHSRTGGRGQPKSGSGWSMFAWKTIIKWNSGDSSSPRKSKGVCFTSVGLCVCLCVCLSVTTISEKIVEGFVPNFMQRFLGRNGRPRSCFVTIGRGMWK